MGPIQHFPWHSWKEEFAHAGRCGFASIEWLFAAEDISATQSGPTTDVKRSCGNRRHRRAR
jgi:hypothetical protein